MKKTIRDLFTDDEWKLLTENKDSALLQIANLPLPEEKEGQEE